MLSAFTQHTYESVLNAGDQYSPAQSKASLQGQHAGRERLIDAGSLAMCWRFLLQVPYTQEL